MVVMEAWGVDSEGTGPRCLRCVSRLTPSCCFKLQHSLARFIQEIANRDVIVGLLYRNLQFREAVLRWRLCCI